MFVQLEEIFFSKGFVWLDFFFFSGIQGNLPSLSLVGPWPIPSAVGQMLSILKFKGPPPPSLWFNQFSC